jgi:hypothetical protein
MYVRKYPALWKCVGVLYEIIQKLKHPAMVRTYKLNYDILLLFLIIRRFGRQT